MKDEEIDKMADDFVNAQEFTKVYGIARKAECGAFWKYGFLAGLKAGRPQWHDLRKDPNDLPKEHISVLVMLEYGVPYISSVSTDKRWFCTDYYTGEDKVIAWCEIPTFDKE